MYDNDAELMIYLYMTNVVHIIHIVSFFCLVETFCLPCGSHIVSPGELKGSHFAVFGSSFNSLDHTKPLPTGHALSSPMNCDTVDHPEARH